jgi:hypothetical protein
MRAAGESRRFFIHDAERQKVGGFELGGVLNLLRRGVTFRETSGHTNDFETAVAQVVSFFGVECEYAIRKSLVGGDERGDLFEPEHFPGRQPMTSVGSPQSTVVAAHHDQGAQESRGLVDFKASRFAWVGDKSRWNGVG